MSFQRRTARIDWRKSLSTDEAAEVARLERRCAQLDGERRELSVDLQRIRNRAIKRATFVPAAQRRDRAA